MSVLFHNFTDTLTIVNWYAFWYDTTDLKFDADYL